MQDRVTDIYTYRSIIDFRAHVTAVTRECTCTDLTLTNCKLQSLQSYVSEITSGNRIVDTSCATSRGQLSHFAVFFIACYKLHGYLGNAIGCRMATCEVPSGVIYLFRVDNSVVRVSSRVEKKITYPRDIT